MVSFSILCLPVGHRLRFWGDFSCFVSFIWCQLFACLIRAAIFRLPPSFVVWSFFFCPRHLWTVLSFFATGICVQPLSFTAFSAVGIRVRLFVFALFEGISVPLSCWHHSLRLPLVRRVGGPRGQPVSILCSMDRRLTSGWPCFQWCLAWLRETCLVCDFFFFSFFLVSVFLLFSFLSFAWCPQMLKSIAIKDNLRCRPTPAVSFVATPWEYRYFSRSTVFSLV